MEGSGGHVVSAGVHPQVPACLRLPSVPRLLNALHGRRRPRKGTRAVYVVGASSSGNALKLLNNLMFGAINAVTAEVFAAAERVGVSPERFYETVAASDAATVSNLFRALGPKILERDFSPTFAIDLLDKDNRLAVEMMERAGTPVIVGDTVKPLNGLALAAGHSGEDTSALVKVYEALLRER